MILATGGSIAQGACSRSRRSRPCFAALGLLCAGACSRQLPPAPTPSTISPEVTPVPAVAGQGQLVIDVVDGPTPVQRIYMRPTPVADRQGKTRYEFNESPEILCAATPCLLNLPVGNVVLGFPVLGGSEFVDVELVHVDAEATVYRRALTYYKPEQRTGRTLGIVSTAFGGMALVTGAALLPIGLAKDADGLALSGAISLGAGSALTALGIWAMWGTGSSYRPGSAIHFSF